MLVDIRCSQSRVRPSICSHILEQLSPSGADPDVVSLVLNNAIRGRPCCFVYMLVCEKKCCLC